MCVSFSLQGRGNVEIVYQVCKYSGFKLSCMFRIFITDKMLLGLLGASSPRVGRQGASRGQKAQLDACCGQVNDSNFGRKNVQWRVWTINSLPSSWGFSGCPLSNLLMVQTVYCACVPLSFSTIVTGFQS